MIPRRANSGTTTTALPPTPSSPIVPWWYILTGDWVEQLRGLSDESVNCVVTSPPFYGLRNYGTGKWEGGDPNCKHTVAGQVQDSKWPGAITTGQRSGADSSRCRKCGASNIDTQLGIERTPDEYVAKLVSGMHELRRVLHNGGVLWLNLGDSCSAHPGQRKETDKAGLKQQTMRGSTGSPSHCVNGCKPKDLIGIPWMAAFALRADGWYLRQEIIWNKPNVKPESVKDRPTRAHEQIFLLTKSPQYWYDANAIKEPANGWNGSSFTSASDIATQPNLGRKPRVEHPETRNKRSVWSVNTQPFKGAHFATFPPKLIEPCILAGCPIGGVVLDPFAGAGTTGLVAVQHGRNFIGIELNTDYVSMAEQRIAAATEGGAK